MNQYNTVIETLSEKHAGSKLKSISMKDSPYQKNHSLITFVFGEGENRERHIEIYGEDLQVSFGYVTIK